MPNNNNAISERLETAKKILDRGVVVGVLPDKESFLQRLASNEPMKIYIGADPTSTALHLSHAKNYMLLEEFRKLGHEVYVLFGNFTAKIGDPSGRLTARKKLNDEEVTKNVQGWIRQIKPLMDFDAQVNPPKIVYNNDWLSKLTMADVIELASNVTVQQMIERDMFAKRINEKQPIFLNEFMYPLMQGYDSVALDVDAELCGSDQTFNALMGRTLLKKLKQKDKFVVTVNLMENPITHELMSKSRGTGVFLDYDAFNMYSAIMAQPDEMTQIFLINNTRIPIERIEEIIKAENPRDAKMTAALEIATVFHGKESANLAQENWLKQFSKKEIPDEIPEVKVESGALLLGILVNNKLVESKSQARRLFEDGAVRNTVDDEKITDPQFKVTETIVLKVGKKNFIKILTK